MQLNRRTKVSINFTPKESWEQVRRKHWEMWTVSEFLLSLEAMHSARCPSCRQASSCRSKNRLRAFMKKFECPWAMSKLLWQSDCGSAMADDLTFDSNRNSHAASVAVTVWCRYRECVPDRTICWKPPRDGWRLTWLSQESWSVKQTVHPYQPQAPS